MQLEYVSSRDSPLKDGRGTATADRKFFEQIKPNIAYMDAY